MKPTLWAVTTQSCSFNLIKPIEKKVEKVEFLFVGAEDRMEMDKVPAAGYKIIGLWISGLQRNFSSRNLLFPLKLIISLLKARKIIKQFVEYQR